MSVTYRHPRPALAVDSVVFGFDGERLMILLIERGVEPFAGRWALPGGFVRMDEDLEAAARRELQEETGLKDIYLEQLGAYGAVDRDPRGRVVSVAWTALVSEPEHAARGATDARAARWYPADDPPPLAFDHDRILADGRARLREKVRRQPLGFELLPPLFALRQLRRLYEVILGRPIDKRNFRRKLRDAGFVVETGEHEQGVPHRAAMLYRFDRDRYDQLLARGMDFEV